MVFIAEPFVTKEVQFTAKNQFFKAKARFTRLPRLMWWAVIQAFVQICEKDVTDLVKNRDDELELNDSVGIEDVTFFVFSRV